MVYLLKMDKNGDFPWLYKYTGWWFGIELWDFTNKGVDFSTMKFEDII
jgi:hypothetical protein